MTLQTNLNEARHDARELVDILSGLAQRPSLVGDVVAVHTMEAQIQNEDEALGVNNHIEESHSRMEETHQEPVVEEPRSRIEESHQESRMEEPRSLTEEPHQKSHMEESLSHIGRIASRIRAAAATRKHTAHNSQQHPAHNQQHSTHNPQQSTTNSDNEFTVYASDCGHNDRHLQSTRGLQIRPEII